MHLHLYLTAHRLRQTPMYTSTLSIIRPANCQITTKSLCTALKYFCWNKRFVFLFDSLSGETDKMMDGTGLLKVTD